MFNVESLVEETQIVSPMMKYWEIVSVLKNLQITLEQHVPGAIVELGCNVGTTSVFIRRLLDHYSSSKQYHVYDSWQGLPEKDQHDLTSEDWQYQKGECRTYKERFERHFEWRKLVPPTIHSGWFAEIPDHEYPDHISFAFFDGDFYTSIIDSFNKVYPKMSKGGIIMLDDCGWNVLPGVEKACDDFLKDKPEVLDLTGYPNIEGKFGGHNGGGIVRIL